MGDHADGQAARRGQGPQGIALVDKPAGLDLHDVVAKARGKLGTKKVGHSGTLDPAATGLLVLGVGRGHQAADLPDRPGQDLHR
jgi:tRNA U55 pseudouridine synthase TruB